MKINKSIRIILIIIPALVLFITFIYLWFNCMFSGLYGLSDSVSESQRRNVFIKDYEYKFYPDTAFKIDFKSELNIKEVFLEKFWITGCFNKTKFDSRSNTNCHLVFIINNHLSESLSDYYFVFEDSIETCHFIGDRVIATKYFPKKCLKDTINVKLYYYSSFAVNKKKHFGLLELIKKE
ncbi:MAG: hypothetical protein KAT68_18630 [Bacteroidales bacterium]|nr:hypothetical protein [Bacteroidales bacterium]